MELLLDDDLDDAVRREWQVLLDAGLPSQARHRGASNRPHVTLTVADDFTEFDSQTSSLPAVVTFPIRLGPFVVFRGRQSTLARLVVPSTELLALHAAVSSSTGGARGARSHTAPGQWTPHVTLARRLDSTELSDAVDRLHAAPGLLTGRTEALRRWDGDAKMEWLVT